MSKLTLTKDPSHKGYYMDADGNLYVFRFGGRPIKVDDYREDKPSEDFNNKKVEVEKDEIVDGTEKAQKEYKIGGTEGDVYEYAEKQKISYDQAETLLNINGDDYKDDNEDVISKKQFKQASKIDDKLERAIQMQVADDVGKSLNDDDIRFRAENYIRHNYNGDASTDEIYEKLKSAYKNNGTYESTPSSAEDERIFNQISKFYGYDKLSDAELRETLDFAEKRGMYHSKSDIEAMRRVLDSKQATYTEKVKESDKAVKEYQKLAKDYEKIADKYYATDYNSPEYEKLRDEKNAASKLMSEARNEAIQKFSNTIPYQELFKTGSEVAGVKTTFTNPTVDDKGYVKYQSEDIRSQCGPFGEVLKECRLTQFNSSITFDEKTNEPYYWGSMDLQYQHNDGGSNGMKVMDYTYSKKNGWEMTDTKGNIYHNGKQLMSLGEIADYYVRHGYSQETALELANKRISERKTN